MKLNKESHKLPKNPEWENLRKSNKAGWVKTTMLAIAWLFTACDNVPNDQIILNADEWLEKFSIKYQFSEWSAWATLIDYNIFVRKNWETFECNIEQSDWWISNNTKIESDNVDRLFNEIANKLDHDFITDNTRNKKDKKVEFAKQVYKDSILNNKNPSKGETRIKYKK